MVSQKKHKPSCKVWIECDNKPVLGKGGADILEGINTEKSLTKTAKKLGMSYRYVWNYIKKTERTLGEPIVQTYKGGKIGGGGANLTPLGTSLLSEYKQLEEYLNEILSEEKASDVRKLKLSARNCIKGKVSSVEKGIITAKIKIEIQVPTTITAVITKDAAEDLNLKIGDEVQAIIKATEVLIGK